MRTSSRENIVALAAAAAAGTLLAQSAHAQFQSPLTLSAGSAVLIQNPNNFYSTTGRITVEGTSNGAFADYAVLDFDASSIYAMGSSAGSISSFGLTLYDLGKNVTPSTGTKPDTFAVAGGLNFYLSGNTSSINSWSLATNSADLIGNPPSAPALFSLGSLNYTPAPATQTTAQVFNLNFASFLNNTATVNGSNVTAASFIANQVNNAGKLRIIIAPQYTGSGTVNAKVAADLVGTAPGVGVSAPTLNVGGSIGASFGSNNAVINGVALDNSSTKTLALPAIDRLWTSGFVSTNLNLRSSGDTSTAHYSALNNTGAGFNSVSPLPTGDSSATFTLTAGGAAPGALNFTGQVVVHNLDNPNDTTNLVVTQTANHLISSRFVNSLEGTALSTVAGVPLNGTNSGVLKGSSIAGKIDLTTTNNLANNGSNYLSLLSLPANYTQLLTYTSGTNVIGQLQVTSGTNATIFGSGINEDGSTVASGTEVANPNTIFTAGKAGSYQTSNKFIGSSRLTLQNADVLSAVNPSNSATSFASVVIQADVYETGLVSSSVTNQTSLVSRITLTNAAPTTNVIGSGTSAVQIGLRAAAVVNSIAQTSQAGFTFDSGIAPGSLLSPGVRAPVGTNTGVLFAGTGTATATFNSTAKLNGTYSGTNSYSLQHNDQNIAGTTANDLGVVKASYSATVTGNSGDGSANILPGQTYGSIASPYYINRGIGNGANTTVSFVGGTASANNTVAVAFGTSSSARAAGDKAALTGNGTDKYVVQFSYDPTITTNAPALASYDGSKYVNATFGSSDAGASSAEVSGAYAGSVTLGQYGIDTTNHVVWAVVDHPGTFVAYNRAAGDTRFRGTVDNTGIRQIIQRGFYNDGQTTHKWSDGLSLNPPFR